MSKALHGLNHGRNKIASVVGEITIFQDYAERLKEDIFHVYVNASVLDFLIKGGKREQKAFSDNCCMCNRFI